MSQSQIVPVKLTDNEKNRKNEDTHKKNPKKTVGTYQDFIRNRGTTIPRGLPATSTNDFGENVIC